MRGGEPWWVLADICAVLEISNSRNVAAALDADERNTVHIADGNRGNPNITIINESGLWSLVLTSRKPEAKAFKKWLTGTVIPALRQGGVLWSRASFFSPPYSAPGAPSAASMGALWVTAGAPRRAVSGLLMIAGTGIRRDAEGRYCLNDCHRAPGGPGEWPYPNHNRR